MSEYSHKTAEVRNIHLNLKGWKLESHSTKRLRVNRLKKNPTISLKRGRVKDKREITLSNKKDLGRLPKRWDVTSECKLVAYIIIPPSHVLYFIPANPCFLLEVYIVKSKSIEEAIRSVTREIFTYKSYLCI